MSTPSTQVRYDNGATHEYNFESAKKLLATSFDRTAKLKARRFGGESMLRKGLSLFGGSTSLAADEKSSVNGAAASAWTRSAQELGAPSAGTQAQVHGSAAVEQPETNRDPPGYARDERDEVAIDVRHAAGPMSAQHARLAVAARAAPPPHAAHGGTPAHHLRSHHAPRAAERGWAAADPQEAAGAPLPPAFRDASTPVRNGIAHLHRPDLPLLAPGPPRNVGNRRGLGGVPTSTAGGPLPMQANTMAAAHTSARNRCAPYSHDAAHAVIVASRAAASAEVRARRDAASSAIRAASSGRVPAQLSASLDADIRVPWLRELPPAAGMSANHIVAAPVPGRELPDGHARV